MPSDERASSVSLGEFVCLSLSLAAAVALLWLIAKPWEEPEMQPCLRGERIYS